MKSFKTICFFIFLTFLGSASARADEKSQILAYDLYAGGLKFLTATLKIDNTPASYNMAMDGRTAGLIKIFSSWEGNMVTTGENGPGALNAPRFHKSVSVWPDNTQIKEFSWNERGMLDDLYLLEEGETSGLDDIEDVAVQNKVDIMTASLSVMEAVTRKGACDTEAEIFDGKRSFILRGNDKGREMLRSSSYNSYGGEAIKCEFQIIPQEGNWHEKLRGWLSIQEHSNEAGARPVVWLARLEEDGLAVPVKLKAKTSKGTVMMHLKTFQ